jgi:hypothetical protein
MLETFLGCILLFRGRESMVKDLNRLLKCPMPHAIVMNYLWMILLQILEIVKLSLMLMSLVSPQIFSLTAIEIIDNTREAFNPLIIRSNKFQ